MAFLSRFSMFLAPSMLSMAVSLVMVPVTTYVLGPAAFGIFGLMTALTAVGLTLSLIGGGAVCNVHFLRVDPQERRRLVSTLVCVALAIGAAFCMLCLAAWPIIVARMDGFADVPRSGLWLSMATVMLGVPWIVAQDVITLDGRARGFAAVTIAQTLTSATITLVALYVLQLGVLALFLAAAAGAAVTLAGALRVLRPYLTSSISLAWAREVVRVGPANAWASVAEAFQSAIERAFLASVAGTAGLGLYVHAQNYRIILAQVLKAAARPIWPVTLLEAREPGTPFHQTRVVWDAMYVGIAAAGVTFVAFGREIIGWLTHGRFVESAILVPYLVIFLLLQNAGKPQIGILFRDGAVRQYYWLQVAANVVWFAALVGLVAFFGLVGGVLALMVQQVVVRAGVMMLSRARGRAPLGDAWVLGGTALILAALLATRLMPDTLTVRVAIWSVSLIVLAMASWHVMRRFAVAHVPHLQPSSSL